MKEMDLTRLSKEELINLIKVYARLFLALDGFWFLEVEKKFGYEAALPENPLRMSVVSGSLVWKKIYKLSGNKEYNIRNFIASLSFYPFCLLSVRPFL